MKLLPELDRRYVIAICSENKTLASEFIQEWEQWAASVWPDEWRRPLIIAYLGPGGLREAQQVLGQANFVEADQVLHLQPGSDDKLNVFEFLQALYNKGSKTKVDVSAISSDGIFRLGEIIGRYSILPVPSFNTAEIKVAGSAEPEQSRKMAILGGMGPLASAACLGQVVNHMTTLSGDDGRDSVGILYWSNPGKPQKEKRSGLFNFSDHNVWKWFRTLHDFCQVVEASDCEFWIAPSNTYNGADVPKQAYVTGMARLENRLDNMIPIITDYVMQHHSDDSVALLGTTPLKKSNAYNQHFSARGKRIINTSEQSQQLVQAAIDDTKAGNEDIAQEKFRSIIQGFVDQGATVIVLGCTEIHLAVKPIMAEFQKQGITFVDTSKVLAEHAAERITSPQPRAVREVKNFTDFKTRLAEIMQCKRFWYNEIKDRPLSKKFQNAIPTGILNMLEFLQFQAQDKTEAEIRQALVAEILPRQGTVSKLRRSSNVKKLYEAVLQLAKPDAEVDWQSIEDTFNTLALEIAQYQANDKVPNTTNYIEKAGSVLSLISKTSSGRNSPPQ